MKLLVKLVAKLLGVMRNDDEPRADMYLPEKLLAIALVFLIGGIVCILFTLNQFAVETLVGGVFGIGFGYFALLCWKNQTIQVESNSYFTYTTMFGKSRTYAFADIQGLRQNRDSMTLFVAGDKVHIESMAVMSQRLVDLINKALENQHAKEV